MVGGNVIEGSSQNLKGACAFIEECFLKFWMVEPPGLCGTRPPFHEHHVTEVFGNNAIQCHVLMFSTSVHISGIKRMVQEANNYKLQKSELFLSIIQLEILF
jgi:hypothetical protein